MTSTVLEPAGYRGPWCTVCGHVAVAYLATLDPRRPVGYCRRGEDRPLARGRAAERRGGPVIPTDRYGKPAGCGRVIATYDLAEAEYAYRTRRRKLTEARHSRHDPERPGRRANWCAPCAAVQAARAHDLARSIELPSPHTLRKVTPT